MTMGVIDAQGVRLDRDRADELAERFVTALLARGIGPGARVMFQASNSPELLAAIFGCLRSGFAPIVVSSGLTASELTAVVEDVGPALLVDAERCDEFTSWRQRAAGAARIGQSFACRPVHFTSGTSGKPKPVWSGWLDLEAANRMRREEDELWGFVAEDEHLVCSPLSHSAPLRFALYTLLAGGSVHVPMRFNASSVVAAIEAGVTSTFMAPAQLGRVLGAGAPASHSMRFLAHAGASCPEGLKREAIDAFGADVVVEFYGSTEGQFTVCPSSDWLMRPGTVGHARPGRTIKAVDGQLWCRPPDFARFVYWGDPEKTAATWDGDWFTVGDLGRVDGDGYVFLEGRRSDLIISGGVNVYPAEVERILRLVPGLTDVCVIGEDDTVWGQRVCAVVVGTATDDELDKFAKEHLAPYKRPKVIVRRQRLPLTDAGKVDRRRIAAELVRPE